MKEKHFNIRIKEELLSQFTKTCKSRKDTKTEIVTKAIEDYINHNKKGE